MLKIQNVMDIKEVLLQWFINSLIKKSAYGGGVKNENISNQKTDEELHKPVMRKFEKRNVQFCAIPDVQIKSKFNQEICFFILCH